MTSVMISVMTSVKPKSFFFTSSFLVSQRFNGQKIESHMDNEREETPHKKLFKFRVKIIFQ